MRIINTKATAFLHVNKAEFNVMLTFLFFEKSHCQKFKYKEKIQRRKFKKNNKISLIIIN